MAKLNFETEPDYDRCRDMFKAALKKRRLPCDGKIDFSAPKSPAKKVSTAKSPARTKKTLVKDDNRDDDSLNEEEEDEEEKPKKRGRQPAKKKAAAKKKVEESTDSEDEVFVKGAAKGRPANKNVKKLSTRDAGSQTSPNFVAMAKAAKKRKAASTSTDNEEMAEFVAKAKKAAKAATNGGDTPKKRGRPKKDQNGETPKSNGSAALDNPTPAMMELMQKKLTLSEQKKPRKKKTWNWTSIFGPLFKLKILCFRRNTNYFL